MDHGTGHETATKESDLGGFVSLYASAKRLFDILFSLLALFALWPLMILIALAIKLDSKGPVLYQGKRTGLRNIPFYIYKFRTMHPDAEKLGTTTKRIDPRITRVGHLLRKFKLDELPQFINVLKGEMSIVGPRPEVEEHTNEYTEEERAILTVKPGITDFASVELVDLQKVLGDEDPHQAYLTRVRAQKNQLRLRYVYERSLWTDIKIIAITVFVILKKLVPVRHPAPLEERPS